MGLWIVSWPSQFSMSALASLKAIMLLVQNSAHPVSHSVDSTSKPKSSWSEDIHIYFMPHHILIFLALNFNRAHPLTWCHPNWPILPQQHFSFLKILAGSAFSFLSFCNSHLKTCQFYLKILFCCYRCTKISFSLWQHEVLKPCYWTENTLKVYIYIDRGQ